MIKEEQESDPSSSSPFISDIEPALGRDFMRNALLFAETYISYSSDAVTREVLFLIYSVLKVTPGLYPVCAPFFCDHYFLLS